MNLPNHPFHLVTIRPWPLLISINLLFSFLGLLKWFNFFNIDLYIIRNLSLILILYQWWRDVIRERTFQGYHTSYIKKNLKIRIILFITSEIFFFISLFWAYFHFSLSPRIEIGRNWPPKGIQILNPFNIPLLNSIILISSGITISWSHNSILLNKFKSSFYALTNTLILGVLFTFYQYIEYHEIPFTISDSCFGSIFFLTTGFHGIHVIIGTLFLFICWIRIILNHFSKNHHFGYEAAIWYWHFVDIVWLFVYTWIYWWSF